MNAATWAADGNSDGIEPAGPQLGGVPGVGDDVERTLPRAVQADLDERALLVQAVVTGADHPQRVAGQVVLVP